MPMPEFLDYWTNLSWREFVKHIGLYAALASVLSILGPFNTYNDPFLWRFSYWLVMFGFFGGLIMPLLARSARQIGPIARTTILRGVLTLIVLGTVPMTLFVMLTDWLLYKWIISADWLPFMDVSQFRAEVQPPDPLSFLSVLTLYANVLAVVLISIGAISLLVINRYNRQARSTIFQKRGGVNFFSRVPDQIGTDLIYLQMEDHYLRVVTKDGHALILVRFRDALNEIADLSGLQVHRSWWVASSHIVKFSRSGRRAELVMSNQARIPVSASYKNAVEQIFAAVSK